MDTIADQFQNELLNIIQVCFHRPEAEFVEADTKGQKRDVKGEFLDKVTPFCVSYLEQRNFDTEKTSQFFNVPYVDITFGQLSKDFKLMHSFEYVPGKESIPYSVILCRMFMAVLNRISIPDTTATESQENIKNISIAVADLFLSINAFVLYYVAKQELVSPIQNNKKSQGAQHTIIGRIIDKLAPLICDKKKIDAVKLACQQCPDLQLRLIEYAELKRTSNEEYFKWFQLDKFFDRKDFSPITTLSNIRDNDTSACWESPAPINLSVITIPLLCDNATVVDEQQTDLVSKLQHLIGEQKKRLTSSKFVVQVGTVGQTVYIIDLLSVEEREVGLSEMTWVQRINYLKRSFNVVGDSLDNLKIVEPLQIQVGILNTKIQNEVPKHIIIKTLGFGMYRSFYSSPKTIKRPHDEKTQAADQPVPDNSGKKIRF
jgi:hypothetical protein